MPKTKKTKKTKKTPKHKNRKKTNLDNARQYTEHLCQLYKLMGVLLTDLKKSLHD